MTRNISKIFAVILCMALAISMLALPAAAEEAYAASVGETGYATVAEAVANANGETVKLLTDSEETVTASGDLYLDLNGHTLAGLTITDGTLYGMDTTTDDYVSAEGYGKITSVIGEYAFHHKLVGGKRYLAAAGEEGVSFHRFYLAISHKSLKPNAQGVGYKALFAGDHVVKQQLSEAEAFGYTLQLGDYPAISRWKSQTDFAAEKTLSLRINNYDPAYGETELKANVQIQLASGEVITSSQQTMTLKGMVEEINSNVAGYSPAQLDALAGWLAGSEVMLGWDVANILDRPLTYDMNVPDKNLVVTGVDIDGALQAVTVKGTKLTLDSATLENGVLTIPAASFIQDTMPSGELTLVITTEEEQTELTGQFTWVIRDWDGLAYMEKHLVYDGTAYTGSLALDANIDASGKVTKNFTMFTYKSVFNGSFDGRNYTVSNLNPSTSNGLIGMVGESGIVKNLKLTDVLLTTNSGGVTYMVKGTLKNIYVQGSITGDGMHATSNLVNFGCGLLFGQVYQGATVNNCIVELTDMSENLRLATAFGKLHSQKGTEHSLRNCYAVNADRCTYMPHGHRWVKRSFTTDRSNVNFDSMEKLWQDEKAAALAASLGLEKPDTSVPAKPDTTGLAAVSVSAQYAYDANANADFTLADNAFTGDNAYVTVCGTNGEEIYLENAAIENGALVIPAESFVKEYIPSGNISLCVITDSAVITVEDICVSWLLQDADDVLKLKDHLVYQNGVYTGNLALGRDIDLDHVLLKRIGMCNETFAGSLDGRDHTIRNVTAANRNVGLLGNVSGTVKNLRLTNALVCDSTAVLVGGLLTGTVENVYVQGTLLRDGTGAHTNIDQLQAGLLAAGIGVEARITNVLVEITDLLEPLYLATAFGKLQSGAAENVFTNCYAVNADSGSFMQNTDGAWVKCSFSQTGCESFDNIYALWKNEEASALAASFGLEYVEAPALLVTMPGSYDMNVANVADLSFEDKALFFDYSGNATILGSEFILENVTIKNGKLTIPAASFQQATMPSGNLTLEITDGENTVQVAGEFVWVMSSWDELAVMENHMLVNEAGDTYTGSLALAGDVDATGKNINNLWKTIINYNGSFDGRNHTVNGIVVKANKGLFRNLGVDGVIKNLKLTNITVGTYGGALVGGSLEGRVENVYAQGIITADGMGETSNLANFGASLLCGRIHKGAKVSNCIVELTSITEGLRLATAFGKMHQSGASESTVFTNCYAIGAEGCTFMKYSTWEKLSFATNGNKNFATMHELWQDSAAMELAKSLNLPEPPKAVQTYELAESYAMNTADAEALVITGVNVPDFSGTATVKGTDITLKNVTITGGTLQIPAVSFVQELMPSGDLTLLVETDTLNLEITGDFIWTITNWSNKTSGLAYMAKHLTQIGDSYYGHLALGADIALATDNNPGNFAMGQAPAIFEGTFDGNGYTISGYNVKTALRSLFYQLGSQGVIKNLKMTGVVVSTYAAPVVYKCYGTLENIYVEGSITKDGMGATSNLNNFGCGLLAGYYFSGAKVNNCIVTVTSIASGLRLGTAFGKVSDGTAEDVFSNCFAIGAAGEAYMEKVDGAWTKCDFTGTNANFTDLAVLKASGNAVAIALAKGFGLIEE